MAQDRRRDLWHVPSKAVFVAWADSSSPELWQLLARLLLPCTSLPFSLPEPRASFRVQLCHPAVTSWADLQFHRPWSRLNCWTQHTLKRPALWQARAPCTGQFCYLKHCPIIIPLTDADWHPPLQLGQIQAPQTPLHQPRLDSPPTNTGTEIRPVPREQSSFSLVCGEVNKISLQDLPSPELPHYRLRVGVRVPGQGQIHHLL